jgi:hypothetical protein
MLFSANKKELAYLPKINSISNFLVVTDSN